MKHTETRSKSIVYENGCEIFKPRGCGNLMRKREAQIAMILVLPFLLCLFVFVLVPGIYTFYMSLMDFNTLRDISRLNYIGLQNYLDVFGDPDTMASFGRSFYFTLVEVPLMIGGSLGLAMVLNLRMYARGALRTVILVPYVCNVVAVSIAWQSLFDPTTGAVNTLLASLGVRDLPRWFSDPGMALTMTAIVYVYLNFSYQALVFLAALQGVTPELYEAAEMDGAGPLAKFLQVTLPCISPTTFFLVVSSIIGSFQTYNLVATLTRGGPGGSTEVASFNIVKLAFTYNQFSMATAQSMLLFVFLMFVTILQFKGQKKWVNY